MAESRLALLPATLVLIVGVAVLTLFSLSLFAKRQISRVTIRSRRGAHYPIGQNAPRNLQREITRRLEQINQIKYEPKLLVENDYRLTKGDISGEKCSYIYRLKALDAYKQFDHLVKKVESRLERTPDCSVRKFVIQVRESPITPMKGASSNLCKAFIDAYEHARYGYKVFSEAEYNNYMALLHELLSSLKPKTYKKKKLAQQFSQSSASHRGSFDRISTTSTVDSRQTHSSSRGHRSSQRDKGNSDIPMKARKSVDIEGSQQLLRSGSDRRLTEMHQL
ncbi:protein C1orf43 homolog [Apostichopus japonicus]|uniref:protein C1orf43 homolog n=1 Tax=Stichopus japonicus TaxID=307972 RepID=UPI003AB5E70C